MLKSRKQEAFAQHYALHGKPSEAYRHAYEAGRMKPTTISVKAAELLQDGRIAARVRELQAIVADKAKQTFNMTANTLLARLQEIDQLDVADILDDEGRVLPVRQWPKAWRTSIGGMDVVELKEGDIGVIVKRLKLPDKGRNLQMIGRHVEVQAFKDKIEHDASESFVEKIHAARERARDHLKERGQ